MSPLNPKLISSVEGQWQATQTMAKSVDDHGMDLDWQEEMQLIDSAFSASFSVLSALYNGRHA